MLALGLRRLGQLVVVLFVVSSLLFFLLRLSGDPVLMLAGPNASPATITQIRHDLGFDAPLPVQYARFLESAAQLHFGQSITSRQDALGLVFVHLPYTALLAVASVLIALIVGLPLGVFAGGHSSSPIARVAEGLAFLGQSMPSFWLGILLILAFSVHFHWLPSFGTGGITHLVLPAITLAAWPMAKVTLLVRSGVLEAIDEDYMRTARAKGLSFSRQLWRHAVPNALIPVASVIGMDFGQLLGGAVITETIFAWPGIGQLLIQSVRNRDYPVVQATVFLTAILVVVVNAGVDIGYRVLDPRVKVA